ncbi:hypothetical protein [Streptomyces sp. NPDC048560]|uniref:hypothetical protein n=1 Tax=Streptomyces sp. NPDC048560 TaxID=3155488 RepID=UPI00344553DD
MFNQLEVRVLPPGSRWPAQAQLWIDGEDVVAEAVGDGGRGPVAEEALGAKGRSRLWATGERRRVVLGEPECTGGCCGFLSVFVQRQGRVVEWSDWQVPGKEAGPPIFHFDADQYDIEVARASSDWASQR